MGGWLCLPSCTRWSLHHPLVTKQARGLLPRVSTLTKSVGVWRFISVALVLVFPRLAVSKHLCSMVLGLSSLLKNLTSATAHLTSLLYHPAPVLSIFDPKFNRAEFVVSTAIFLRYSALPSGGLYINQKIVRVVINNLSVNKLLLVLVLFAVC